MLCKLYVAFDQDHQYRENVRQLFLAVQRVIEVSFCCPSFETHLTFIETSRLSSIILQSRVPSPTRNSVSSPRTVQSPADHHPCRVRVWSAMGHLSANGRCTDQTYQVSGTPSHPDGTRILDRRQDTRLLQQNPSRRSLLLKHSKGRPRCDTSDRRSSNCNVAPKSMCRLP